MVGRDVQRLEVVPLVLDLWSTDHGKTESTKDVLKFGDAMELLKTETGLSKLEEVGNDPEWKSEENEEVERPARVKVKYLDLEGKPYEIEAGDVSTASDFGEELLGLIFRQNTLP